MEHFGERLGSSRFGDEMTRAMYGYPNRTPHQRWRREQMPSAFWSDRAWQFRDEEQTRFSDVFLLWNRDQALRNLDLSLAYFDTLAVDEFETAIAKVLVKGRSLRPVDNLADWEGVEGVYVMVFDRLKQIYVGQSINVRKRVRQHWVGRKSFDRLVFGTPYDSILPVDELRALDTTRLYAARSLNRYALEERIERVADPRFTLNRSSGGAFNPFEILLTGARARDHTLIGTPSTPEDYETARDALQDIVATARRGSTSPASPLAALDMVIRVEVDQVGRSYFWSNRDLVGSALVNGLIDVAEFEEFLTLLGETVVWPA